MVSIWEDVQLHLLLGNYKVKQRDTTIHLLERLKSKKLSIANDDKNVEQQELSSVASGNAQTAWLENGFAVSYKTNH